ncbi:DUF305 domain-containing protein [Gordonia defluvii]|uniref:DUF305 domain-containing protein n=1 Tax=Gordonia defluvii TaxID=283718 RepID=A0ABP6LPH1_9ACTN|nr:DUF305 domain-containing protein [Gordonia sp. UBA5067]
MSNDEPGPASSAPRVESDAHRGRTRALVTALAASAALLLGIGVGFAIGNAGGSDQGRDQANATAVGFAQDMIVHHRQAVEMTQAVIEHGSDPAVRALARRMGSAQTTEIGQMTGWLQAWGAPAANPGHPMSWMGHDTTGGDHARHGAPGPGAGGDQPVMDGMATEAEMTRLRSLSGPAVDTYFLQLMLRHHQGGHHMMAAVVDPKAGAPTYVVALAEQMNTAQTAEEATMTQLLASRNAAPLP